MERSFCYDVAVIGGGTAGTCAAIQAGRLGARVVLIEASARLGGTIVNSGIARPGMFHAWGKQICGGIGWELVTKALDEARMPMPDWPNPDLQWWKLQIPMDPMLYSALCDEAVLDAGVELRLHAMPGAMERDPEDGWTLAVCGRDGLETLSARRVVDCSGDAIASRLAGATIRSSPDCQPATLSFDLSGYDDAKLDRDRLDAAFVQAVEAGELRAEDACWQIDKPQVRQLLYKHGRNANHIPATPDCATARGRTALEVEARASVRRIVRWLRTQPGLEKLSLDNVFPEVGVRESVTVEGLETVTREDYCSGRVFPDAVCYSFYPIDAHGLRSTDWETENLKPGVVATVPRGATIARGVPDLLVAGRILSSDHLANSALRTQPTCMATGQAAGALAVLSVRQGVPAESVPMDDLRATLLEHGAILP
ncbi:MAG: FAD-dependent oxidoreductase [Kiritimatiellia bacterium]